MVKLSRLQELRKKVGMTQKQLAELMGVKPHSIQRLEYGTSRPSVENLVRLADIFDVSLDYLIGRSDDPNSLPDGVGGT